MKTIPQVRMEVFMKIKQAYQQFLREKADEEHLDKVGIVVLGDGMIDKYHLIVFKLDTKVWMINQVFGENGGFNVA